MRKINLMIGICTLLVLPASAQIHLFLQEQEIELEDSRSSAWVFPVTRDLDEALDDLRSYCRDRSDVRMRDGGVNLVIAEKVSIPAIATKRGDLIGFGFITENYYAIALIFQLGYDISVNSREWAAEMSNFRSYAKAFMSYHYEQFYTRRIDDLEKELKALERDTNQNENRISSTNRKIGNLNERIVKETDEAKIADFKSEISTLESDLQEYTDLEPQLETQIKTVQANVDKLKSESNSYQTAIGAI